MPRIITYSPIDAAGRDLRVGDWVRVVSVPGSVAAMPRESRHAFSAAVGKTFQIEAFDRVGCAELDLSAKVGPDTIWIEPFCLVRTRRPTRRSARFSRILAIHRRLKRPRWSFSYTVRYRTGCSPLRRLARLNASFGFGHGWYVLEKRREIHGTFSTYDRKASSRRQLEGLRLQLKKSGLFGVLRVSRMRLSISHPA
jgi:hypothetical protein